MISLINLNDSKYFYITVLILILICIIYIVYVSFIRKMIAVSKLRKSLKENHISCVLTKYNYDGADYKLKYNGKEFICKIVYISSKCELQINNKEAWYIYKNKKDGTFTTKLINSLIPFIKSKEENKIVFLSSAPKAIKKVINESEMIMVNSNIEVYGIHILTNKDFNYLNSK